MARPEKGSYLKLFDSLSKIHVNGIGAAYWEFEWLWRNVGIKTRRPFGGLVFDGRPFKIADIAKALDLPDSTVRLHLDTLKRGRYLATKSASRLGLRAAICLWSSDAGPDESPIEILAAELQRKTDSRQSASAKREEVTRQPVSEKRTNESVTRQPVSAKAYSAKCEAIHLRQQASVRIAPPLHPPSLDLRIIKTRKDLVNETTSESLSKSDLKVIPGGKRVGASTPLLEDAKALLQEAFGSDAPSLKNIELTKSLHALGSVDEIRKLIEHVSGVVGRCSQKATTGNAPDWIASKLTGQAGLMLNRKAGNT